MPLVRSGMPGARACRTFERASRTNKMVLTARAATNTAGVMDVPGRSHSVRALAISRIVVKKRKTFSKIEGRNDFECSRGDKSPIAMVAAKSSDAAAMVARVRDAVY